MILPGSKGGGELNGQERSALDRIHSRWRQAGFGTLELTSPRGTGRWLAKVAPVVGVSDHTVAEWGLWVGRPLLGQWVWDILRWLDLLDELRLKQLKSTPDLALPNRPFALIGLGAMSVPVILAAAIDPRVAGVTCSDCLVSFVGRGSKPWSGVPMGLIAPNILDVGDIGHLAALVAPRPLVISGGFEPEGAAATGDRLVEAFEFTRGVYRLLGAPGSLTLGQSADVPLRLSRP